MFFDVELSSDHRYLKIGRYFGFDFKETWIRNGEKAFYHDKEWFEQVQFVEGNEEALVLKKGGRVTLWKRDQVFHDSQVRWFDTIQIKGGTAFMEDKHRVWIASYQSLWDRTLWWGPFELEGIRLYFYEGVWVKALRRSDAKFIWFSLDMIQNVEGEGRLEHLKGSDHVDFFEKEGYVVTTDRDEGRLLSRFGRVDDRESFQQLPLDYVIDIDNGYVVVWDDRLFVTVFLLHESITENKLREREWFRGVEISQNGQYMIAKLDGGEFTALSLSKWPQSMCYKEFEMAIHRKNFLIVFRNGLWYLILNPGADREVWKGPFEYVKPSQDGEYVIAQSPRGRVTWFSSDGEVDFLNRGWDDVEWSPKGTYVKVKNKQGLWTWGLRAERVMDGNRDWVRQLEFHYNDLLVVVQRDDGKWTWLSSQEQIRDRRRVWVADRDHMVIKETSVFLKKFVWVEKEMAGGGIQEELLEEGLFPQDVAWGGQVGDLFTVQEEGTLDYRTRLDFSDCLIHFSIEEAESLLDTSFWEVEATIKDSYGIALFSFLHSDQGALFLEHKEMLFDKKHHIDEWMNVLKDEEKMRQLDQIFLKFRFYSESFQCVFLNVFLGHIDFSEHFDLTENELWLYTHSWNQEVLHAHKLWIQDLIEELKAIFVHSEQRFFLLRYLSYLSEDQFLRFMEVWDNQTEKRLFFESLKPIPRYAFISFLKYQTMYLDKEWKTFLFYDRYFKEGGAQLQYYEWKGLEKNVPPIYLSQVEDFYRMSLKEAEEILSFESLIAYVHHIQQSGLKRNPKRDQYLSEVLIETERFPGAYIGEVFQNSLDAKAIWLKGRYFDAKDGVVEILEDDGTGMAEPLSFIVAHWSEKKSGTTVGSKGIGAMTLFRDIDELTVESVYQNRVCFMGFEKDAQGHWFINHLSKKVCDGRSTGVTIRRYKKTRLASLQTMKYRMNWRDQIGWTAEDKCGWEVHEGEQVYRGYKMTPFRLTDDVSTIKCLVHAEDVKGRVIELTDRVGIHVRSLYRNDPYLAEIPRVFLGTLLGEGVVFQYQGELVRSRNAIKDADTYEDTLKKDIYRASLQFWHLKFIVILTLFVPLFLKIFFMWVFIQLLKLKRHFLWIS